MRKLTNQKEKNVIYLFVFIYFSTGNIPYSNSNDSFESNEDGNDNLYCSEIIEGDWVCKDCAVKNNFIAGFPTE